MKKMIWLTAAIVLGVSIMAGAAQAQIRKPDLQMQVLGGLFSPVSDDMQDMYGTAPLGQLYLVAAMNEQSRLKIAGNLFRKSGNPYIALDDFIAGDPARLALNSVGLLLEVGGRGTQNPKVYIGAGLLYCWGSESIDGMGSNSGDGLGGVFTLTPEFQLSQKLYLAMEASLRLIEVQFTDHNQRYRFNLSGGALSIGLGYQLSSSR